MYGGKMNRSISEEKPASSSVVQRGMAKFLHIEMLSAFFLLTAIIVAMIWANFALASYQSFWNHHITVGVGSFSLSLDFTEWINEGLMTFFFLVVGLEVKREIVDGELKHPRRALVPILAALGGMTAPALVYLAINLGTPNAKGWAIPMATDTALSIALLSVFRSRIPEQLRVFLLSLAIVDDIAAIVVISVFLTGATSYGYLIAALPVLGIMYLILRFLPIKALKIALFGVLSLVVWVLFYEAHVHATLAGIAIALLIPVDVRGDDTTPAGGGSTAQRVEKAVHPSTSYLIVPLFALANAGVAINALGPIGANETRLIVGIVAALVFGKLFGIFGASWATVKSDLGQLPTGLFWSSIMSAASVAGIGFTVSLFLAELAFGETSQAAIAKVAILAGSILAAILGSLLILTMSTTRLESNTKAM